MAHGSTLFELKLARVFLVLKLPRVVVSLVGPLGHTLAVEAFEFELLAFQEVIGVGSRPLILRVASHEGRGIGIRATAAPASVGTLRA